LSTFEIWNSFQSKKYSNDVKNGNKCWKCGHRCTSSQLFCDNCRSIQAIDGSLNYFHLFEQKVSFDINLNDLNQRFKRLQMLSHPDKHVMASDRERQYSENNSFVINRGYKTLRDPYERGLYLLKLSKTGIPENESIGETGIDSQFLTNIMKLNEDIEENYESKEKLLSIFNDNKHKMNETLDEISDAFNSRDIIRAKELLSKFKFFITLDTNLKHKLEVFQ